MIGIFVNQDLIRYIKAVEGGKFEHFDHPSRDDHGQPIVNLQKVHEAAEKQLGFTTQEDFRLLVDYPLCYSVTQSVPFPENQLATVLENYLEEELPHDIEEFSFEFKVLATKGASSAIIGFWIQKQLLSQWTRLADELSFNSLDIQPAEMAFIPSFEEAPHLKLEEDLVGNIRYTSFIMRGGLPHLVLGRMPAQYATPEEIVRYLKFQGPNWKEFNDLILGFTLERLTPVQGLLGIPEVFINDVDVLEPISAYAAGVKALADKNRFNYRKGEFAQKRIEERILIPVALCACAVLALLGTLAYQNYKTVERETTLQKSFGEQNRAIWKSLYPGEPFPPSNLYDVLKGRAAKENKNQGGSGEQKGAVSSLQTLGRLFSYIPNDKDIIIKRVTLSAKTIELIGTTEDKDPTRLTKLIDSLKAPEVRKDFTYVTSNVGPDSKDKQTMTLSLKRTVTKPGPGKRNP